jgi:hypothetical protein
MFVSNFLYILLLIKREREKGYMETNTGVGKRNSNAFDEHAWPVISWKLGAENYYKLIYFSDEGGWGQHLLARRNSTAHQ